MHRSLFLAAAALLAAVLPARAGKQPSFGVAGIARYHQSHTAVREWPFDKGDMSYGASLRFYDGMGFLELGCEFAADPTADDKVLDQVVTPFARLALKDQGFVAAFGVRDNYVTFDDDGRDDEWTDLLYEFHLGLEFDVGPLFVGGGAYYSFDDWGDLGDFDADDLEFGAHVGFAF